MQYFSAERPKLNDRLCYVNSERRRLAPIPVPYIELSPDYRARLGLMLKVGDNRFSWFFTQPMALDAIPASLKKFLECPEDWMKLELGYEGPEPEVSVSLEDLGL